MSYEINEVVIIDGSRNIVNAGVGTFTKVHPAELEVGSGGHAISDVLNETDLNSDSPNALPTQHAVKAYVDTAISAVQSDVDQNESDADAAIAANEVHIDNAATLSGVAKDSVDLGTFTGSTISDASTIKAALQDLETVVESAALATSVETITSAVDANHYLTFVNSDNGSATQETIFTDAGLQYNPSSDILTVGEVVISGNLTVSGTQTIFDTTVIQAQDKNITLGVTTAPTDAGADGGGLTLMGTTNKTFNWINATDAFTASEHISIAAGKEYRIGGVKVVDSTSLGSLVVNSSLTSVGTLTDLTVAGDINANGDIIGDGASNISGINQVTATSLVGELTGNADSADEVKTRTANHNAAHFITFVDNDHGSAANEVVRTNSGIKFNPSTNLLDVSGGTVHAQSLTIDNINLTSSATELNYLDGSLPGTATASNAVVLDASNDIAGINNIDIDGNLVGDGASNISGISSVTASGKMYAQAFTVSSDANLKENIAEIPNAVEKVEAIRGVTFDWKDGSGSTAGIIAQEVEAVMPMLVENGEFKRVEYNGLVGLLIEAVKELSAEVKALKAN